MNSYRDYFDYDDLQELNNARRIARADNDDIPDDVPYGRITAEDVLEGKLNGEDDDDE